MTSSKPAKFDGILLRGNKLAAKAEFDAANNRFDLLLDDGSHDFVQCANATREEVAAFLAEIEQVIPVVRKETKQPHDPRP